MSFDERGTPMIVSQATDGQLEDFSRGFCHFLAMELHARHGWPMRVLGVPADAYSIHPWRGIGHPRHVYCLNDHGRPVDVFGVFSDEGAIQRFYADQHDPGELLISVDVTTDDIRDELGVYGLRMPYSSERDLTAKHVDQLKLHTLA